MNPEDVPLGDRVLPGDRCEKCGAPLVIYDSAGDTDNTLYVGCPDGEEIDGHTHYPGIPEKTLDAWGWKIPAWCMKS